MTPPIDLRPYLDELERFADGQMSESEQAAFELRMEQDEQLSAAYEAYERFTADLRWVAGHETLRHRLIGLDKRLDQRQQALTRIQRRRRRTQVRWTVVAGVLAVLLGLGIWLWLRPHTMSPDEAWTYYYTPEPGLSKAATRKKGNTLLSEAMLQYRNGQYPEALQTMRRISEAGLSPDSLYYYTGVVLLRQGDAAAARSYLVRASRQPGSALTGKALYHLGMAQWRTGLLPQAQTTLRTVAADSRNPYQRQARKLLRTKLLQPQP
ncbi:tetratricopeptide repeat protein [Hymenobacter psychrotolerans]|uniref:Tetratricopeptide repeat-containing protein n=1 Tax=Hymenobacter psychrotolerans DSM 18569 TaxID=1121959 RepID=A0A1M6QHW7_9BACT|nr:tetratricopeptide repeat protein [Hymenobacter psychrotolerans]SHK19643.1 Tetratricopeptide repeat-containing protein [Hymenobacter psychrotolerans DSM 18569]